MYDVNGAQMTEDQIIEAIGYVPVTKEEFAVLTKQVAEIHEFIMLLQQGVMNHPMFRSMIPPTKG